VIGTNKKDAAETVELLLEDASAGLLAHGTGESIEELLQERGVSFIEYAGWERIDRHERERGAAQGRPRVKHTTWDALLTKARELDSNA
jgi:ferredoxin--NADP+ reductase